MIRSVNQQGTAEEVLRKSTKAAADYKRVLEEALIVDATDHTGIINYANDNFCRISKYSREELIGHDHRIINSGFHSKQFFSNLWAAIEDGKTWRGELKNKAKDGTFYWVDIVIVPFLNEEGTPYEYVTSCADITARKEAEELLQKTLKELSLHNELNDSRAEALIIANQKLALQNDEKEKRAAELIIANFELKFQNREKEKRASELVIANIELAFQNREKEKRAAELIVANEELAFQNKEKEKWAGELTASAAQLKSVNQELESFSYSVSHDLRTPLRAINGYAKILEEDYNDVFDDEGRRILAVVRDNAKKMGLLIDDLLTFSRLGRKEMKESNVNMKLSVENALAELGAFGQFKAVITINDLPPVIADATLINQVWINLLSNAIKYSSNAERPAINIGYERKDGNLVYSVTDNGVGFDMKYIHKLFGVFQRLHSATAFEGTGVGLALVHGIIAKHGGSIWAEAEVNKGATFYFSLPNKKPN